MSYEFVLIGGLQNSYLFQTINLIVYEIKFIPTPYLFGENSPFSPNVFEFSITVAENPANTNPAFDNRTPHTIAAIFTDLFLWAKRRVYHHLYLRFIGRAATDSAT